MTSVLVSGTPCGAHHQGPFHRCPPFLHSWNRTGSGMLREGLGFALHQHNGCRVRSPCGVLKRWKGVGVGGTAGGDSCRRTKVQHDVGLFTQDPVKIIVPRLRFSTCLCFPAPLPPPSAGFWGPHNCPPAASDWGHWLPVQ